MDNVQDITENLTIDMSRVVAVTKLSKSPHYLAYKVYFDNDISIEIYQSHQEDYTYPREKFIKLWKEVVNGEK